LRAPPTHSRETMAGVIDAAAAALHAASPVFSRGNLYHAVRRARGAEVSEAAFDAAVRRRLQRGRLPGLLSARRPRGIEPEAPKAVLLVDRSEIVSLFGALGPEAHELAVVGIDGTPRPLVAGLAQSFREGLRLPVLYLHDAATVIYPFLLEPLASLVESGGDASLLYRDLGLPPLGAAARRFGDPAIPDDEVILELEAVSPAALLEHCLKAARSLPDPGGTAG
jgi:hypothetical protein